MPDTPHATATPTRRKRAHLPLPPDFNDPAAQDTLGDVHVFAAVLDAGVSTLYRYVADGRIEKPTKIGRASKWPLRYMRRVAAEGVAAAA
jgi:hypothetical protein